MSSDSDYDSCNSSDSDREFDDSEEEEIVREIEEDELKNHQYFIDDSCSDDVSSCSESYSYSY